MTNQIAIFLGLLILCGLAVDFYWFDWSGTVFLTRKLVDLLEWMAFWR